MATIAATTATDPEVRRSPRQPRYANWRDEVVSGYVVGMAVEKVSSAEARNRLNALLADVERTGKTAIITNHGRDVALLVPATPTPRQFGQLPSLSIPTEVDEPLPDADLARWEGGEPSRTRPWTPTPGWLWMLSELSLLDPEVLVLTTVGSQSEWDGVSFFSNADSQHGRNADSTQFEVLTENGDVPHMDTRDSLRLHDERGLFDYHEPQPMLGDQSTLARVVEAALFSAADPRDGLAAVEQRRRLRVLFLLELYDQSKVRPVPVDGKPRAPAPFGRRVSSEPVEGRLAAPGVPRISSHRSRT